MSAAPIRLQVAASAIVQQWLVMQHISSNIFTLCNYGPLLNNLTRFIHLTPNCKSSIIVQIRVGFSFLYQDKIGSTEHCLDTKNSFQMLTHQTAVMFLATMTERKPQFRYFNDGTSPLKVVEFKDKAVCTKMYQSRCTLPSLINVQGHINMYGGKFFEM